MSLLPNGCACVPKGTSGVESNVLKRARFAITIIRRVIFRLLTFKFFSALDIKQILFLGGRTFKNSGRLAFNSLPSKMKEASSLAIFKRL